MGEKCEKGMVAVIFLLFFFLRFITFNYILFNCLPFFNGQIIHLLKHHRPIQNQILIRKIHCGKSNYLWTESLPCEHNVQTASHWLLQRSQKQVSIQLIKGTIRAFIRAQGLPGIKTKGGFLFGSSFVISNSVELNPSPAKKTGKPSLPSSSKKTFVSFNTNTIVSLRGLEESHGPNSKTISSGKPTSIVFINFSKYEHGEWNEIAKELFFSQKSTQFKNPKHCRERWNNHLNS